MIAPVKPPSVFNSRSSIWELRDGIQDWRISMDRLTMKHKATVIKTSCFSKIPPSLIKSAIRTKPKGMNPTKLIIISRKKLLLNLNSFRGQVFHQNIASCPLSLWLSLQIVSSGTLNLPYLRPG